MLDETDTSPPAEGRVTKQHFLFSIAARNSERRPRVAEENTRVLSRGIDCRTKSRPECRAKDQSAEEKTSSAEQYKPERRAKDKSAGQQTPNAEQTKPNARSSQQDTGQDSYKVKTGGEEAECTAKEKNQHILIFGHCTMDGRCEQQPATPW